jgi:hypothetical protein
MDNKITLKEFEYNGEFYNLFTDVDQIKFNTSIRGFLNNIHQRKSNPTSIDITETDIREYSVYKSGGAVYYIDKSIMPVSWLNNKANLKVFQQAIIKAAMVEIALNKNESISFVNGIYTQDKLVHREARMSKATVLDRLDKFRCGFESKTVGAETFKIVRHFGTTEGQLAYSNTRRQKNRSENNHFIRVLMYGPTYHERPLFDPFTRNLMENYTVYNEQEERHITVSTYTLHHALFINGKSVNKYGDEPSKYLNQSMYQNYTYDQVTELMGCIALGEDGHKIIHATHRQDDIKGWISRYKRGECFWIPYHWINQENYQQTINWLVDNVENFTEELALSYTDFVKANSL